MKFTERIEIDAPVSDVWEYVSKPDLWPGWVTKIQLVEKLENELFRIEIGGKSVIGKIENLDTYKRMRFVGVIERRPDDKAFAIEYQLASSGRSTNLTETQDLGIPFPFNLLVKLIHTLGKPKGPTNLEVLKEICESRD